MWVCFPPHCARFYALVFLARVDFDPCMFEQSYLEFGARQCFSSHGRVFANTPHA